MLPEDLAPSARAAGEAGQDWMEWTFQEDVQAAITAHAETGGRRGRLIRECEKAYEDGRRAAKRATWTVCWTTAPEDYDTFGTETLIPDAGEWCGKTLRQVAIDPRHLDYQSCRYGSGLHGTWEKDPREEEKRWAAEREKERSELAAREERRGLGRVWLSTLTDEELSSLSDEDYDRGFLNEDVRAEKKSRAEESAEKERAEKWTRCRALFPAEPFVLVSDQVDSKISVVHNYAFRVPGKDSKVYYDASVAEVGEDADRSWITAGREQIGSLADVAWSVEQGHWRVARSEDVPPKKVLDRIGHDKLAEIKRLEINGRSVWVGRARFSYENLILDEKGRIIRAKKIVEEASRLARI